MRKRAVKYSRNMVPIQYFVRPFQKDALKKSVAAHFQDFLSGLPAVAITERLPNRSAPWKSTLTRSSVVPPPPLRSNPQFDVWPAHSTGQPGGLSGEVPNRFRAFSPSSR